MLFLRGVFKSPVAAIFQQNIAGRHLLENFDEVSSGLLENLHVERHVGDPDTLARRLSTEFTDVRIERRSLPWHFDSGPALITFLRAHSPVYVVAAQAAGDRAGEMFAAIERAETFDAKFDAAPVRSVSFVILPDALRGNGSVRISHCVGTL